MTLVSQQQNPVVDADDLERAVEDLRRMAISGLGRMYQPREGLFVHCLRRTPGGDRLEGISRRYTAIALIGLAGESDQVRAEALPDTDCVHVCERLIDGVERSTDLGDVALTLWAARALEHPEAHRALDRLRLMKPESGAYPTVEVAWALSAQVVPEGPEGDPDLAERLVKRLLATFHRKSHLFAHYASGAASVMGRGHVCCYADLVYPIQALAHYHRTTGHAEAKQVAEECAERMCVLQGSAGQWWWHYDVRTGGVLEGYPVYAIHQDAMGPMALFAVLECCGADHRRAIRRSVRWLLDPPEIEGSLVDREADVIWRKVMRREPPKLVRRMQAAVSRVHPSLRVPGVDAVFPPVAIDFESRPYHMGWLLYAFPLRRVGQHFHD